MNKKGQSLVSFVIILPMLVFFMAFFIDSGMSILEKEKMKSIIESNMKIILKEKNYNQDEIINVLKKNDSNLQVKVNIQNNMISIIGESKKKRVFGNLFNWNILKMQVAYCGNYLDGKIEKNCEMIK